MMIAFYPIEMKFYSRGENDVVFLYGWSISFLYLFRCFVCLLLFIFIDGFVYFIDLFIFVFQIQVLCSLHFPLPSPPPSSTADYGRC